MSKQAEWFRIDRENETSGRSAYGANDWILMKKWSVKSLNENNIFDLVLDPDFPKIYAIPGILSFALHSTLYSSEWLSFDGRNDVLRRSLCSSQYPFWESSWMEKTEDAEADEDDDRDFGG